MSGELFRIMAGIDWTHVPYRGQSLAVIDMISGQIQLGFPSIPASVAHIKSRRLAPLGVTTTQRATALPDVPTISEAGLPGYEVSGWYGVIGPAGMPRALITPINEEINKILKVPELRDLNAGRRRPRAGTPKEFAAAMASDLISGGERVRGDQAAVSSR
jgi:tripartite-type tricarboxylate transporter receptor subunit TctC